MFCPCCKISLSQVSGQTILNIYNYLLATVWPARTASLGRGSLLFRTEQCSHMNLNQINSHSGNKGRINGAVGRLTSVLSWMDLSHGVMIIVENNRENCTRQCFVVSSLRNNKCRPLSAHDAAYSDGWHGVLPGPCRIILYCMRDYIISYALYGVIHYIVCSGIMYHSVCACGLCRAFARRSGIFYYIAYACVSNII